MAAAPLLPCPLHRPGSRTAAAAGPQTLLERLAARQPCGRQAVGEPARRALKR